VIAVTTLFYTGLSAIVTSGSFLLAAFFYIYDALYKRRERRRSQAVHIDVWLERVSVHGTVADVHARVSNRSNGTVRQVYFELLDNFAEPVCNPYYVQIIPPNSSDAFPEYLAGQFKLPEELRDWPERDLLGFFKLQMRFADAAGITWKRDYRGHLHEVIGKRPSPSTRLRVLSLVRLRALASTHTKSLVIGLVVAVLVLIGGAIYLEVRGSSASYVDGYNFAVAFQHGNRQPPGPLSRRNADASCSVWSLSNAGGVPRGDVPREWRAGCEAALESGAFGTI
jgi:hypothetical protein